MSVSTVTLLAIALIAGARAAIPSFDMNFACDDVMNVYSDYNNEPHLLGSNSDWRTISTFKVPTMTKVLSVSCLNFGGPAGILAGTEHGVVLTNATWKCSSHHEDGWNKADFDDSKWDWAKNIDSNSNPTHYGWKSHTVPSQYTALTINDGAYWIGANGVDWATPGSGATSYCRLKLVYNFKMVCDDYSVLYADGVYIGNQQGFQSASFMMQIPKLATVFAVNCTNLGSFAGFVGSTDDNHLITDGQWKVFSQYRNVSEEDQKNQKKHPPKIMEWQADPSTDWAQPEFDDSDWDLATVLFLNSYRTDKNNKDKKIPWPHILYHPDISADAAWISGKAQPNIASVQTTDRSSYFFRRRLGCMWKSKCRLAGAAGPPAPGI